MLGHRFGIAIRPALPYVAIIVDAERLPGLVHHDRMFGTGHVGPVDECPPSSLKAPYHPVLIGKTVEEGAYDRPRAFIAKYLAAYGSECPLWSCQFFV